MIELAQPPRARTASRRGEAAPISFLRRLDWVLLAAAFGLVCYGLWVVAGIGMAVATGNSMAWVAGFTTLLVVFTLNVLNRLELVRVSRGGRHTLSMALVADREALARILVGLTERRVELHRVNIDSAEGGTLLQIRLEMRLPAGVTSQILTPWLGEQSGVVQVEWE